MTDLRPARILAIETSCDETGCAILENGRVLLGSAVASQMEIHARYGGVYPEVASRQHILSIIPVIEDALGKAHLTLQELDAIAATRGPGLAGSLVVGLNVAKGLALGLSLPLVAVNHLEGHLYSPWVYTAGEKPPAEPEFPLVVLLASGGHTELDLMTGHLEYKRLGATLDDAAGEAFDKVARLLGLGYPGGPAIQAAAEGGSSDRFNFPRSWLPGTWDFSFSGVKTAVLRETKELQGKARTLPVQDMAASFQSAVIDVLYQKTMDAAREFGAKAIVVAGGVSANRALRQRFESQREWRVHIPPIWLCTDNAAMIAAAGYYRFAFGQTSELDVDVEPTWPLS